jgi:hypothetical protein
MKDFAANPGRLRTLSTGAKLLYSAFVFAALMGLFVSWKLYGVAVGNHGARAYYGGETTAPTPAPADVGGPSLDLPQEEVAKPMVEQISDRRLLEATHFHVFTIPVYVLILAHLWLLTRLPKSVHTAGVIGAVASTGIHIAGPWIVRGHPSLSVLMPISAVTMLFFLGAMALASAIDMWMPRAKRTAPDLAPRGFRPAESSAE